MNALQKLKWLILCGITDSTAESPVNRLKPVPKKTEARVQVQALPFADTPFTDEATTLANSATTLDSLYAVRSSFDGCPLKKTAAHTLNGYGADHPTVLCLIEAPETADDKMGQLLSGEAGTLFKKMLAAIDLDLSKNTYVSALIPWRPPGNRKPTEAELAICKPFWEREIALLKPQRLLLFGAGVSDALLGINSLSKTRGKWYLYHDIPTFTTIPPTTLLKLPAQKKQAWADLQTFQKGPTDPILS